MAGTLKHLDCHPIKIGGVEEHVHLHHRKISYQEAIRELFKRHRVAFDERYVWDCPPEGRDALSGRVALSHFTQG